MKHIITALELAALFLVAFIAAFIFLTAGVRP